MQFISNQKFLKFFLYAVFASGTLLLHFVNYPFTDLFFKTYCIAQILVLFVLACGLGMKILQLLKADTAVDYPEKIAVSAGLGLGTYSLLFLGLGLFKVLYPSVIIGTILFLGVLTYDDVVSIVKYLSASLVKLLSSTVTYKNAFIALPFVIFLLLGLLVCFAPPTYYDSLVYHLALPDLYLKNHAITKIAFNLFSNFPQNIEMLFLIPLALNNDILANLIVFLMSLLCLYIMILLAKFYYDGKTALYASLLFIVTPSIILLSSSTYIEMGLCFFMLLALLAFIMHLQTGNDKLVLLSGIFSGLALGSKYLAGMNIIAITLLFLIYKKWKKVPVYLLTAAIMYVPWGIKSLLFTGDPFFPFLQKIFINSNIPYLSGTVSGYFELFNQYKINSNLLAYTFKFPYALITEGVRFAGGFDVLGGIGWILFVILLPTLIFIKKFDRITTVLSVYLFVIFAIWFLTGQVLRFLVPLIPVLCVLSALGLKHLMEETGIKGKISAGLIIIMVMSSNFMLLMNVFDVTQPLNVAMGVEERENYLARQLNNYDAVKYMNEKLPANSSIFFIGGEQRGYYCKQDYIITHPFAPNFFTEIANSTADSENLYNAVKQQNITHLYLNLPEVTRLESGPSGRLNETGKKNNKNLIEKHTKLIYSKNNQYIFEIQ
ncbi:MAG: hypothetical protein A2252_06160 [Elusimicrobia bacterium RIFOXYA2_FULL_39_19]|nr:MAG: hypothetical protein A2252_06160 [Elusimicrobia bacterium RIFOXYA2_FULL_39_19]